MEITLTGNSTSPGTWNRQLHEHRWGKLKKFAKLASLQWQPGWCHASGVQESLWGKPPSIFFKSISGLNFGKKYSYRNVFIDVQIRFSSDVQSVLRCIVTLGLDSSERRVVHETLIRWSQYFLQLPKMPWLPIYSRVCKRRSQKVKEKELEESSLPIS